MTLQGHWGCWRSYSSLKWGPTTDFSLWYVPFKGSWIATYRYYHVIPSKHVNYAVPHWQNAVEVPEANHSASTLSFHQLREPTRLSQIRKSSPGLNTACRWPLILWFSRSIFYSAGTIQWQWGNGQCRVGFQWRGRLGPATFKYMPWLWDERIIFRWYERCVHTYIELMVWN